MKKIIFTIVFLLLAVIASAAEPKVLTQFFGQSGIKNKSAVYHGEMLEYFIDKPTLGEGLSKDVQFELRELSATKDSAIYAVLLTTKEQTKDWYAFLVKENGVWKLSAVRTLALPGIFFMALQEIEEKNPRTEDEEWEYQNMLLTIKSDSELKTYLKENIAGFNSIITLLTNNGKEQAELAAKSLFINLVGDNDDVIELNIGGILDNSVGYLFLPAGKSPPTANPEEYIYIEQIINDWYIYKTT